MEPLDCYRNYVGLKTHFSQENYDYFTHNPRNVTVKSYNKRKDRWVFEKLSRHSKPIDLMVSCFTQDNAIWPEFLIRPEANELYMDREKRLQSLRYTFSEDIKKLDPDLKKNIICEKNELPPLIKFYIRSICSLETLTIISDLIECIPYWQKQLKKDFLWQDKIELRIIKYRPFLNYDRSVYSQLLGLENVK